MSAGRREVDRSGDSSFMGTKDVRSGEVKLYNKTLGLSFARCPGAHLWS